MPIIDPLPSGRRLPLMQTIQDAAKLNVQERTTFYVSAYLFQCWISDLVLANSAQLAEKAAPNDRSFQTGEALRGFHKFFGNTSDAEFPSVFSDLIPSNRISSLFPYSHIPPGIGAAAPKILSGNRLLGIMPLRDFRHAEYLQHEVPDMAVPEALLQRMWKAGQGGAEVGLEIALEILAKARARGLVHGAAVSSGTESADEMIRVLGAIPR